MCSYDGRILCWSLGDCNQSLEHYLKSWRLPDISAKTESFSCAATGSKILTFNVVYSSLLEAPINGPQSQAILLRFRVGSISGLQGFHIPNVWRCDLSHDQLSLLKVLLPVLTSVARILCRDVSPKEVAPLKWVKYGMVGGGRGLYNRYTHAMEEKSFSSEVVKLFFLSIPKWCKNLPHNETWSKALQTSWRSTNK